MSNPFKNNTNKEMDSIFLKLSSKEIVYLKAILESYDELGVLRTLNQNTGEVVILSLPGLRPELDKLLDSLGKEIDFEIQEKKSELTEDWLIEENVE